MRKLLLLGLFVALFALRAVPAAAENPHDGYMFWLPCGELEIGNAESQKVFQYNPDDLSLAWRQSPQTGNSDKGEPVESFVIHPRQTRFDVPAGQMVIIAIGADKSQPEISVNGKAYGSIGLVTFIPRSDTDGKRDVKIEIKSNPGSPKVTNYRFYYTDDADKLGVLLPMNPSGQLDWKTQNSALSFYLAGVCAFWAGDYTAAKAAFTDGVQVAETPQSARLFRRLARWTDANEQFGKIKTGEGFYKLGLYSMVNGYWDLAYESFKKATELMPDNPDAWYMLGDAASYKYSDLDMKMEKIYPYYKKAADLYPRKGANTFRTFFGFFKKLRIKDGDKETVLNMTEEQMDYVRKVWEWNSAIMEAASKGMLRMVNTYKVIEEETDSRDPWDSRPYQGLFKRGEVETFMKMTGWGASDACGMDCGPDRSAFVNMGIREWDTLLHEWNHTLDWSMITSELGIGVPTTHSSDWCGFEPISSMGMGHHSCNRYYMTPGMYQYQRGIDPVTTPYITDWSISGYSEIAPAITREQIQDEKFMNEWTTQVRKKTAQVTVPLDMLYLTSKPVVEDGYINLKATLKPSSPNTYAFATTYIYSPKKQKVRMWIGADDNMRMWLNGRLIHKGTTYWSCALFTECKEKDMTAKGVLLEKGWNKLTVQITNAQRSADWLGGDPDDCWGFSVRICDNQNREVPGIKWQSNPPESDMAVDPFILNPKSPKTYSWEKVADDYTVLIPELTINDLRAITGYKTMTATNEIFFDLSKETLDPSVKPYVLDKADPKNVALNNELNWYFSPKEFAAVVRYKRGSQIRDLLFLRPEVYESYLKLIPVTPEARKLGIKKHSDQVIGYFLTEKDESPNGRIVLVVDTYLGDKLPIDEEDLLRIGDLK